MAGHVLLVLMERYLPPGLLVKIVRRVNILPQTIPFVSIVQMVELRLLVRIALTTALNVQLVKLQQEGVHVRVVPLESMRKKRDLPRVKVVLREKRRLLDQHNLRTALAPLANMMFLERAQCVLLDHTAMSM